MPARPFLHAVAATAGVTALLLTGVTAAASPESEVAQRDIRYIDWRTPSEFASGTAEGVRVKNGALTIAEPVGTLEYTDPFGDGTAKRYEYATWTSDSIDLGFAATELIPSWNAKTPGGSWVEIKLRGVTELGDTTKWYILGRWAEGDAHIHRTSVSRQGDDNGYVAIDTFVAYEGRGWTSFQVQVTLLRPAGTGVTPRVRAVGAVASRLPDDAEITPSTPSIGATVLDVPQYSQQLHVGHYPEWDNGGQAWCSPTSTSMILSYWGKGPKPEDYAWVEPKPHQDPWVDYAARHTYDYNYEGAGNWPFNTAYAARYGLNAFVTRLRSLNEAEAFIAAGIPIVVSAAWEKGEVPGADYGTNGHLLLIVGFDADGNPVMNDPNAKTNDGVRKTFGRAEFERVWLSHSGGVTYVIHPPNVPLPPAPPQANW